MSTQAVATKKAGEGSSGVRAALRLSAEIERARGERDAADALVHRLTGTLGLLLESLDAAERDEFQRLRGEAGVAPRAPRGGEVYENVIELFRVHGNREWTFQEIQDALHQRGKAADPKSIYNLVNYLTKTGRIRRVARGRYFVHGIGAGMHLAEDFGDDGTTRATEHEV
jgi:hypothetical protein